MLDVGLLVGFAGIGVAALAGILGVWMERDRARPPYFAILFSLVIVFASFIELGRSVVVAWQDAATEDAMATVLEQLAEISERSGDPALASFVGAELSRSDPKVMKRVQKKVAAKGGDPDAVKRRAAEGRRPASAAAGAARTGKAKAPDAAPGGTTERTEGKVGKAGGERTEGKVGKAAPGVEEAVEGAQVAEDLTGGAVDAGKVGKALEDAGKVGKAVQDVTAGKTGKAVEDAGKALGGALGGSNPLGGSSKTGKKAP